MHRISMKLATALLCAMVVTADAGEATPDALLEAAKKAEAAVAKAQEEPWQKLETKLVPLPNPRQALSPGLFDPELAAAISFPKDGAAVDSRLPHAGVDKSGKELPPLMAKLAQNVIWIDLNGDGKPGLNETRPIKPDGTTDIFSCDLHYEGGTTAPYAFRLKTIVEKEKFAIQRACARSAEFQGQTIVLLDDSGNGLYNDADKDALIVGGNPVCFVSKHIAIGEKFYEVLIHAAGTTLEIRLAPKVEHGWVDLFEKFKPPQKSENLRIHTLIVSGPQGSFALDDKHHNVKVPAGAYDLVFGLFERAKEWMYLTKGDKTSFSVSPAKVATPGWGGVVKAKFDITYEGKEITVSPPAFQGEGSERYVPENWRVVAVTAGISQVYTDKQKLEKKTSFGARRYDVKPNGDLEPVTFKPYRNSPDEYEVNVDYNSGIIGSVNGRQRYQFIPQKKAPGEKGDKKKP